MASQDHQKRILHFFKHLAYVTHVALPEDERDPRLKKLGRLHRGTLFSCFHAEHLEEAKELYEALYKAKDFNDFYHLAEEAREVVNEGLYVFAMTVAILHRSDCDGIIVPPIQEIFPDRFIPAESLNRALKADINRTSQEPVVVEIQETGNIFDPEYHLAYFREDIGANAHHWHWHIVYPGTWDPEVMHITKDRKGELFYYMHQQMCARYDCDRLSTGLRRLIPFHNFHEELEGYNPHLTSLVSGQNYASRPAGLSMKDIHECDVQDMIRWRERILDAIHIGFLYDDHGNEIPLDAEHGTDLLADLMESSYESKNREYYGSLHNWGHVIISQCHDPDGRFKENPGVMSDTSTSLRDPIFYRYHRFVDNIFQELKASLPPYKQSELDFTGIDVVNVTVNAKAPNLVHTFFAEDQLELRHGINTHGSVKVKYHHLDHEPFTYNISVENKTGAEKDSTVRIFLGPKYDELGNHLRIDEARRFYIELDKFHAKLSPGKNVVTRKSSESNVVANKTPNFDELEGGASSDQFCSCGWPNYMLLPRGNHKGMEFELFVMLTDWGEDHVGSLSDHHVCHDAFSYCGVKDQKYPDKKPMGFPFDRVIKARSIAQFKTHNMSFTDVTIQFKEH
uniref:Hemocyanin subunit f n=1 Tax=Mastigoproctus giganteus TaxID=58767 RepID=G8YZS3_MASGI|nr:hemocyanin subunit f [Mastigoproctus giganteus]